MSENAHKHEWTVYSTAITKAVLLVSCECGARGYVRREHVGPIAWRRAFHAPSDPFRWHAGGKVEVYFESERSQG